MNINVGSVVAYQPFMGGTRMVRVVQLWSENGDVGFDGTEVEEMPDGTFADAKGSWWGRIDQVTRVIKY